MRINKRTALDKALEIHNQEREMRRFNVTGVCVTFNNQLLGYMDSKKSETGYLLKFDFCKESNKESKANWVDIGGKKIF